jgi:hypothetical protein
MREHAIREQEKDMERLLATVCRFSLCIMLQGAALGTAVAQAASGNALQMTAMLWAQTANAGAAMRRVIESAEARKLWDDPEIKRIRAETENSWDFTASDGVPGFGPLPASDARDNPERADGNRR